MDTSTIYIEMCEKATDIQQNWLNHDTEGDFAVPSKTVRSYNGFWELQPNKVLIVGNDDEYDLTITKQGDINKTGAIWLPRQDQLQEMVGVKTAGDLEDCGLLKGWDDGSGWAAIDGYRDSRIFDNFSMEQLWLAFVMKEKYNKTWDGVDWVKRVSS
jgi:hypothetical protein